MRGIIAAGLLILSCCPSIGQAKHQTVRHYLPPVWVTGYDLPGFTASGAHVRPGICATDWVHIPRGARVTVPGLGTCVALDTGVWGWAVDWWFPTAAQCYRITGTYYGGYYT